MANKTFSRGIDQITAEASLAFVGNTSHDVGHMIRKTDLFADLLAMENRFPEARRVRAFELTFLPCPCLA